MTRKGWLAFTGCSLLWGIPYLFIKIAVRGGLPPALLAWGRVSLAAVVLLALAARAGKLRGLRAHWRGLVAYGVVEISIPFPMIAAGEERVASSLAAIIIASVPLIGAVLALRFDHAERPTRQRALGLAIGFAGVIALVGIDVAGSGRELLGAGAILLAAVGYAIGPMVLKHWLDGIDPRAMMGASLAVAAVVLTPFAATNLPAQAPAAGAIAAVVVLGLVCTAAAFVIVAILIREVGTSRALVITYVNPVIAVALGVVLLGEQPGAGAVAGLLLILAGSWLGTRPPPTRRRPPLAGGLARIHRGAGSTPARRGRTGPHSPPTARMNSR